MQPLINHNGITVKQLKELIKDWPEVDEFGEETTVWVGDDGNSNIVTEVYQLNLGDIIFEIKTDE